MANFEETLKNIFRRSVGQTFWVKKTLTSSAIPQNNAPLNLITAATGRLAIRQIYLQTDATGLAGGTNFELAVTNSKGVLKFAVETVANLGANITKVLAQAGDQNVNATVAASTFTVTSNPCMLEAGKTITYAMSVGPGTGAGTVDVYVEFERMDENAYCYNT